MLVHRLQRWYAGSTLKQTLGQHLVSAGNVLMKSGAFAISTSF